ncbi:hypothetical protein CRENBAI_009451, partial [Crenichthys baileyi]
MERAPTPPPNTHQPCQIIRNGKYSSSFKALITVGPCTFGSQARLLSRNLWRTSIGGSYFNLQEASFRTVVVINNSTGMCPCDLGGFEDSLCESSLLVSVSLLLDELQREAETHGSSNR